MHPRFPAIPTLGHRAARGATAWRRAAGLALLMVLTGLLAPRALGMPRQGELATPLELKAKTTSGTPVKGQIQSWTFDSAYLHGPGEANFHLAVFLAGDDAANFAHGDVVHT